MDTALQTWIEGEADSGMSPAEIERKMKAEPQFIENEKLPSLRTIRRVVEDRRPEDSSGAWRIKNAEAEDARLILDVLADVIIETEGRKGSFTKKEASWVLKLRKVAPDARPYNVWRLAREYMVLENKKIADTATLDHYLAFRPWTNRNRFGNYEGAIALGWITEDPLGLWDTVDRLYSDPQCFPNAPRSLAETHPFVIGFSHQWWKLQEKGRQDLERELSVIKDQHPEMIEKIFKEGSDARRRSIEYLKAWSKRPNRDLTAEDEKAWASIWAEFKRLLKSAGEQQ